jgi:hypothetical protein
MVSSWFVLVLTPSDAFLSRLGFLRFGPPGWVDAITVMIPGPLGCPGEEQITENRKENNPG